MTLVSLAVKDLFRNPLRLGLTVLAAAVGILAFVFLRTVIDVWYAGVANARSDRLIVRNQASITSYLPLAYLPRIAAIPGVGAITYVGWFGGRIGDSPRDFFPNYYVDPATYLRVFDEFLLDPAARAAFEADPCGAVVGRALADRFGWKVGDRVTLAGTVFPGTWDFTVRGIYEGARPGTDTTAMAFPYRCVNERVPDDRKDRVGYFAVRIDDPARSAAIARTIDRTFASSPDETRTESERAFQLGFVAMSGALLAAIRVVGYVILAILLLVVGNTLAMGVREKTVDLATMRALGFRPRHVVTLVLVESLGIGLLGAAAGIAGAPPVIRAFGRVVARRFGPVPELSPSPGTLALALGAALLVGLVAGAWPAARAARLGVAEGLRRVA